MMFKEIKPIIKCVVIGFVSGILLTVLFFYLAFNVEMTSSF